jgi:hypothetical protein
MSFVPFTRFRQARYSVIIGLHSPSWSRGKAPRWGLTGRFGLVVVQDFGSRVDVGHGGNGVRGCGAGREVKVKVEHGEAVGNIAV